MHVGIAMPKKISDVQLTELSTTIESTVFTDQGVYLIITIFDDFREFSAKMSAFFQKTNVIVQFLQKLAVF
jgi:hypothetical protein